MQPIGVNQRIALALAMCLCGCGQTPQPLHHNGLQGRSDIHLNVIAVDSDGVARDPVDFHRKLTPEEFSQQVQDILNAMDEFHDRPENRGKIKKILIFVHGGMNTPETALAAADQEIDGIKSDGYFPIFVNWQSDLIDSYGEHLMRVTQGVKEYEHSALREIQSPLYLLADLGRAISRIPIVWINQGSSDIAAAIADQRAVSGGRGSDAESKVDRWAHYTDATNARKAFSLLYQRYVADVGRHPGPDAPHEQIQISIGPDRDLDPGHFMRMSLVYWLTSPVKFGTSWIIDGLGKSAWDNMLRRTLVMFEGKAAGNPLDTRLENAPLLRNRQRLVTHPSTRPASTRETSAPTTSEEPDWNVIGAVDYLKNQLAQRVAQHAPQDAWEQYEITLVGHSMGSIVLNEWVRRNDEDGLYYKNIVYMAAACSVRGFSNSIVPYLHQHKNPKDMRGTTRFYDLTLHPTADLREKNRPVIGDLCARGSLLVWIDDFLADPATPLDRTLGRWANIVQSAYIIPEDVRGQITIKAMSLDPDDRTCDQQGTAPDPQTHGSFRCFPYWQPTFWQADPPNAIEEKILQREIQRSAKK